MPLDRDFYDDKLPKYDSTRRALRRAVSKVLDRDHDLIALGGHEQAIAHRIAVYLERSFPGFHTDCEYNRNKHKGKNRRPESPNDDRRMRPDIIVHRRNTSDNVLAVEMKTNANPATTDDKDKLKCLKSEKTYLYKGIAFVCIRNTTEDLEGGILSASIDWYDLRAGELVREPQHYEEVTCRKHSEQVKRIVRLRRKGG